MEVENKREWFHILLLERARFFDLGLTSIFLDHNTRSVIMFWKCVPEGQGPWLSSREK